MKKYTEGPWNIDIENGRIHITDKNNNIAVCRVPHMKPQSTHDAHLIAAAPELLEALEALWEANKIYDINQESDVAMMVKNAIKKAKGETNT